MTEPKNTTGPEPERLKIDGDWEDAVKKALDAKPPPKDQSGGDIETGKEGDE